MIDSDVEDLQIWSQSGVRPALYIQHKRLGLAPLNCFGNGLRRALLIATTVQLSRNGMLLIDDLETAIHPQLERQVFAWLVQVCAEQNIQVFATTHSLETLDAMLEASGNLVDLIVYRLVPTEAETTTTRFNKAQLIQMRQEQKEEVRW
jgi:AAA15 family ATPase/GTPase